MLILKPVYTSSCCLRTYFNAHKEKATQVIQIYLNMYLFVFICVCVFFPTDSSPVLSWIVPTSVSHTSETKSEWVTWTRRWDFFLFFFSRDTFKVRYETCCLQVSKHPSTVYCSFLQFTVVVHLTNAANSALVAAHFFKYTCVHLSIYKTLFHITPSHVFHS